MNIMEIVSCRGMNGAINHCWLLSRELQRRGHRITLVCHPKAWIARRAAEVGLEIVASDLHRWPLDELWRIARLIRERGIEVVHTHLSRAHFFGVLLRWLAGVPSVATAHSKHFQLHWMLNDQVVAVSEATRRYHIRRNFVLPGRIETITNFIDFERITSVESGTRSEIRCGLGIEGGGPWIGILGSVIRRKGLIHLVGALPSILKAIPGAGLLVIGTRNDRVYTAQVEALAESLGVASRIVWAGHRDDVENVLSAIDLFVLPSLQEDLPLSILEAMAAGLPVVATNVGGVAECVSEGRTGSLVAPGDSEALARAIIDLASDPARCRQYGEAGRRRVEEEFSAEIATSRLEAVFARVARRKAA